MNNEQLDHLRHSGAHLLAAAVMELWPHTKRTIGPSIENGFYYDFDFGEVKISEADLPKIEAKMREILPTWKKFERFELTAEQAKQEFADNPYKLELIDEFAGAGQTLTIYQSGAYRDLCRGGHTENPAQELKHFKLLSLAGAYWRGSEKNKMLTRIYGTCWSTPGELDAHLQMLAEAKKRDHRRLGQELDLFSISPLVGQGLVLWHPKLAQVRNVLEAFWKELHYRAGYQLVATPHIANMDLFVISRHLSKYVNSMFPVMLHEYIEGESAPDYQVDEILKPMNCPGHIQIYQARPRSYRELPLRIGELGTVYRYERAGVLHGMTRVRGFTQDDSHIFCTPDQVIGEVRGVLKIMKDVYALLGFQDYQAYIATRPAQYLGSIEAWNFAEESLKQAAAAEGFAYKIDAGEGVFYGPKIDLKVKDSLGREWQLGTVQFDFNQPSRAETTEEEIDEFWKLKVFKQKFQTRENAARYLKRLGRGFDVRYVDSDGEGKQCVMIHRVIFGSLERFMGILIEHFAGAFPVWLAPVQVALLPVSEKHVAGARELARELAEAGLRVSVDEANETIGNKVRKAASEKIPYTVVVGDRELGGGNWTIRVRGSQDPLTLSKADFIARVQQENSLRQAN
ncbi:MAG: threonine--tRNA ligase [Candidatus Magasanikbacteria bacterium]|nr:threonine--tRNA ligase [Candidatus Magasanikbacteria bacterium]